jgi:eukaryotic translation initiation factor 2C
MMIFGIDVNHPIADADSNKQSIAAVVGSIDRTCSYYACRLMAQKKEKSSALELVINLNEPVYELLLEYKKNNNSNQTKFPQRLIFFRDGVSEGQFNQVLNYEMNQIRQACMRIDPTYKPRCTFIVVQKRHHTRMFPLKREHEVFLFLVLSFRL